MSQFRICCGQDISQAHACCTNSYSRLYNIYMIDLEIYVAYFILAAYLMFVTLSANYRNKTIINCLIKDIITILHHFRL